MPEPNTRLLDGPFDIMVDSPVGVMVSNPDMLLGDFIALFGKASAHMYDSCKERALELRAQNEARRQGGIQPWRW